MFAAFFVDGPLRGRYAPVETPDGTYQHAVSISPDYVGPIPWPEPSTTQRADKPWQPSKRIYRYHFKPLTILDQAIVIGWCAAKVPDNAALFRILMNPALCGAVALQRDFMTTATGGWR